MNSLTYLYETPLWILILLASAYAVALGHFLYLGFRLFWGK